jgi:prepilin-type processing-associated H-X9-DG protein
MKSPRHQAAFSKLDLLVMVLAVVGIGLVIVPQFARSRTPASRTSCTNNLKQVGLAFRIWAVDNDDRFPFQVPLTNGGAMEIADQGSVYEVFLVMSNELSTPKILYCPSESDRSRRRATEFPQTAPSTGVPFTPSNSISYFVGLDAKDIAPRTILSGDDHFNIGKATPGRGLLLLATNAPVEWRNERHGKQGNIVFGDGSVGGFITAGLRTALIQTAIATNRLAMP